MSKVVNDNNYKEGSIYRIALENFVTYKQVELYPGTSLNLIVGPNGTGKSTFVCAIILGLCGKTSVIGRAKKVSEYVRSGCEHASIEIELYRKPNERNVVITRTFNLTDASSWFINHKPVREKQVQELVTSLNIQVDNLCQLLPQDRVQDFSKMDPQELLRATLSAVGGPKSVTQLDEMIECRVKQRNLSTRVQNNSQLMQEQIRLNERLKTVIDAMKERKEIEEKIEICEKKKLWIEYQELREKVVEYSNDKKEAVRLVNQHKSRVEPLQAVIDKAKRNIGKNEQMVLKTNSESHRLRDQVKDTISSLRTQEFQIKDIQDSFLEKVERLKNREQELVESKTKLEKLIVDRNKLVEVVGDETQVKMELMELHKPITKTNAAIEAVKKQKLEIHYDLENNITPQIRLYQNKIKGLQDMGKKRLEALRNYNEDCYRAVMWLRDNKQLFEQPVYEPMLLEINFSDPKFARYLEATVPARDLVAFTFESTKDMNKFLQNVRQMGLKRVNAVCSPPGRANVTSGDISQLSYLGFYTYLVDTISAPAAIVRYLCRQYSLHRIPVGDQHTYNNSGKVPANITYFFTENHRFIVRVSRYSGAKSTSIIEVRAARLLANTVDMDQIDSFNKQLLKFETTAQSHRAKMQDLSSKISTLEVDLNQLITRRKKINEGVEKVKTIDVQIRMQKKKIHDIENEPKLDITAERAACKRKQRDCVIKQCSMQQQMCELMTSLHTATLANRMWKTRLELSRSGITQQESELRELKNELRTVQSTLENIETLLNRAKSTAKEKLVAAKRSCNNKLPQDAEFPYRDQFEALPSDLAALHEYCDDLTTRARCLEPGDEQVVKEYEEREKYIEKLKSEVNNSSNTRKVLENRLKVLKQEWLPPLEVLLREIDKSFGEMFEKMGCAGEIKLDKGGNEEDFDKYGILVLVRFRSSEQLQQLTRHTQSGGERAATTAVYLMALQTHAHVPFRCVDEINQGMDAVNERKMLQLLVTVTTQAQHAQYFLLTPKLLANLEYNPKVTVHTIMNGRKIMNYRKWKFDKFLDNARNYALSS